MENKGFELVSTYKPTGDQPRAIQELIEGLEQNKKSQVLLGVTGSGKTFTIANVIKAANRPVLLLSHNKTLASQLYSELKDFFPNNRVEYFVSYFDYYRPEAYMPNTDTYIDKTTKSNWDLEEMRMSTLNSISTKRDTIVVASVASIYGALKPKEYWSAFYNISIAQKISRKEFLLDLVQRGYKRNNVASEPGSFNAKGDFVDIIPAWTKGFHIRVEFFGDEIEKISTIDSNNKITIEKFKEYLIFPASAYTAPTGTIEAAVLRIREELHQRLEYFEKEGKLLEKQRLEDRTRNDLESLEEFGFCPGIENYSRHVDGRAEGEQPFTLFDYLPNDALLIIDESHMMIPQLNGMYNGDRARKLNLVNYGFRLPSALDNRPLQFHEFEKYEFQKIYISATPSDYEINQAHGEIVKQIIRPTGLLDPLIEIRREQNQVEDMFDEIQKQKAKKQRTLILATTKKVSEELTRYFQEKKEKVAYIHSDYTTFERNEILRKLRKGVYDTVIGINLLREGIDLPEVSLIMVLDANKESFFRSKKSLIQIVGRAARNVNGRVIFYANNISKSMEETIYDNLDKRKIQMDYNKKHNIIPKTIIKPITEAIEDKKLNESLISFMSHSKTKKSIKEKEALVKDLRNQMLDASKQLNFERAAELRDIILELEAN
ncbi:excinuclease ABC subunit UvrB [[Mycoplasma] mobile]|uniref:UvrABC system protein B n=1 Tax=Mycoplasma mobile (strain ATCC 43663 / 163K / NCTC 11711) TaxID=267748 RepID=UVRB_MYCM1|nr:excinuclease ABC subunit UvrB [[Mycoplasma] mobile]Q6KH72.1 RecName: Full=UvrABC system protein B; Short=Protein UvrB; AltName: Full=Excinuclease ABC subunit B [Mycoplasma mobile 163K]AAT28058.1 excinuclease ABC helicase subunit B [Mycoplasma mobile 163K]